MSKTASNMLKAAEDVAQILSEMSIRYTTHVFNERIEFLLPPGYEPIVLSTIESGIGWIGNTNFRFHFGLGKEAKAVLRKAIGMQKPHLLGCLEHAIQSEMEQPDDYDEDDPEIFSIAVWYHDGLFYTESWLPPNFPKDASVSYVESDGVLIYTDLEETLAELIPDLVPDLAD